MQPFLKLEIIWEDDDLIELRVIANNGSFSGTTEVYSTAESINNLSEQLENYLPDNDPVTFSAGHGDYKCSIAIKYLDPSGKIIINVLLEAESIVQKNSAILSLITYPANLDNFRKELRVLSMLREGTAVLLCT